MSEDLKKCPVCDSETEIKETTITPVGLYYIQCRKCFINSGYYKDKITCIKGWNNQPRIEQLEQENTQLQLQLQRSNDDCSHKRERVRQLQKENKKLKESTMPDD